MTPGPAGRIRKWVVFAAVAFAAGGAVVAVWRRLPPIGGTGVPLPQVAHLPLATPVAPPARSSAAESRAAVPAEPTARPDGGRNLPAADNAVPDRNHAGAATNRSRKNETVDRSRPNTRRRPGRRKASPSQRTAQSRENPPRPETARDPQQPHQAVPARQPDPVAPPRSRGNIAGAAPPGSVEQSAPARPMATTSAMPRSPVPIPSLPRVVRDPEPAQLARVCHAVEAAAIALAGVSPEFARGITEPFRRAVSGQTTIYPIGMYYFVVREAAAKHDSVTAAANLVSAQSSGAILRFRDLPGKDTGP